jgi:hypothetical protein
MRSHHERNLQFGEPDFGCRSHRRLTVIGIDYASAFASAFTSCGCGASPPAISPVERRRIAAGRGAAYAPSVSTVERGRVAAGRGSTHASSILPVEPGLLSS